MRIFLSLLAVAVSVLITGCAGPEQKLGRGISNVTEFTRMGELNRTLEQTALFEGPETAYTTGFIRGVNRSLVRTLVGAYEVVTFPIPNRAPRNYEPILLPATPMYPSSYKPNLISDTPFMTDSALGFSGGDILPFVPGSRFRIFDY